jgi:hypothetical protein
VQPPLSKAGANTLVLFEAIPFYDDMPLGTRVIFSPAQSNLPFNEVRNLEHKRWRKRPVRPCCF